MTGSVKYRHIKGRSRDKTKRAYPAGIWKATSEANVGAINGKPIPWNAEIAVFDKDGNVVSRERIKEVTASVSPDYDVQADLLFYTMVDEGLKDRYRSKQDMPIKYGKFHNAMLRGMIAAWTIQYPPWIYEIAGSMPAVEAPEPGKGTKEHYREIWRQEDILKEAFESFNIEEAIDGKY